MMHSVELLSRNSGHMGQKITLVTIMRPVLSQICVLRVFWSIRIRKTNMFFCIFFPTYQYRNSLIMMPTGIISSYAALNIRRIKLTLASRSLLCRLESLLEKWFITVLLLETYLYQVLYQLYDYPPGLREWL